MKQALTLAILCFHLLSYAQVSFEAVQSSGCSPLGVVVDVTSPDPATITSYYWEITLPNGSQITASSPQYIDIFSQPGTYDFTLTINGSESTTIEDFILVHSIPTAQFSVNDTIGCPNFCVEFTDESISDGEVIQWSWDFGNGTTSNSQNPQFCYTDVGVYSPVLSIEDEFGCFNDITIPGLVNVVNDFPQTSFTPSTFLDCNPPVDVEFSNGTIGSGELTYNWLFGDGGNSNTSDNSNFTYTFNDTGTFQVCLETMNAIGCSHQICDTIVIFQAAQPEFSMSADTSCALIDMTFTDQTYPVPIGWSWDVNGDGIEDGNTPILNFPFASAGSYVPELTVSYTEDCTATNAGEELSILPALEAIIGADDTTHCSIPAAVSFNSWVTGPGVYSYQWYIDGLPITSQASFDYTFTNYGAYDVSLVVTNEFGCVDSVSHPGYILIEQPSLSFTHPNLLCTDVGLNLENIIVNSLEPIITWSWDFNEDSIMDANVANPIFSYDTVGTFNISAEVLTSSGCVGTFISPVEITVQPNIAPIFTVSDTLVCGGEPPLFCFEGEPGATYSWYFGDDSPWVIKNWWQDCIEHDYIDTGYFDVTLSIYNQACGNQSFEEDFVYVSGPIALFSSSVACNGGLVASFEDASIMADSLVWDFGDGSPLVINDLSPQHIYSSPGTYTVTLTAYNAQGTCPPDITTSLIIVQPPSTDLTFSNNTGCPPLNVSIAGPTSHQYWNLNFTNGWSIEALFNDTINKWQVTYIHDGITDYNEYNSNANFWPSMHIDDFGSIDVTVSTIDQNGCSATGVLTDVISVYSPVDFASFTYDVLESCDSMVIQFIPTSNNLTNWQWQFSDGTISTELQPTHAFTAPYDTELTASLNANNDFGCSSNVNTLLDVVFPATPFFTIENSPNCEGDSIIINNESFGDIVAYSWDFGDPLAGVLNNSSDENPVFNYPNNGTYYPCLSVENSVGCVKTYCSIDSVFINSPEAQLSFTSTIDNCVYGVSFENTTSGNLESVYWSFGDGQFGLGNNVYHTYPIGIYDVSLIVSNDLGCVDTLVQPDIFNYSNVIGPYALAIDSADCAPYTVDFTSFNSADNTFTYFWEFDDGFGDTENNTITSHTYLSPGTYCPSLIMTDNNGCPILVECENPIVISEFDLTISPISPICFGEALQVTIEGATILNWADDSYVTPLGGDLYALSPPSTDTFEVTGFYADCETTSSFEVVVNQLPTINFELPEDICSNDSLLLLTGGMPLGGYYLMDSDTLTLFDPSPYGDEEVLLIYAYTDSLGCSNTSQENIFVHTAPSLAFAFESGICANESPLLLDLAIPAGGTYSEEIVVIDYFDPNTTLGVHQINYSYTDSEGCVATATSEIVVHPVPDLSFSSTGLCDNVATIFTNNSSVLNGSIAASSWNFAGYGSSDAYNPAPVLFSNAGVYPCSLTVTTDENCQSDTTFSVSIGSAPELQLTIPESCQFDTISITPTILNGVEVNAIQWAVEADTIFNPSLEYPLNNWGNIALELAVLSDDGCLTSINEIIPVNPAPQVDFSFNAPCFGTPTNFANNSTIPGNATVDYIWNFGDGSGPSYANNPNHLYEDVGEYFVGLNAISSDGCTAAATQTSSVHPYPAVDFVTAVDEGCEGQDIKVLDLSSIEAGNTIASWQWYINQIAISDQQNLQFTANDPGNYSISLFVTSDLGCTSDSTLLDPIVIHPLPFAAFEYGPTNLIAEEVLFITDQSYGATNWEYNFGDGSISIEAEPKHTYLDFGDFEITQIVTNEHGCKDSTSRFVNLEPHVLFYVPNAFSPDNDGRNDVFTPSLHGFTPEKYMFQVFDRWGTLVFKTSEMNAGWMGDVRDGSHYAQVGVYLWQIEFQHPFSGEIEHHTGHVSLIR